MQRRKWTPRWTWDDMIAIAHCWTGNYYQGIQQVRRYGKIIPERLEGLSANNNSVKGHKITDFAIATYMREVALRAPATPAGMERPPKYLYRRGNFDGLSMFGRQHEPGYIATTRGSRNTLYMRYTDPPQGWQRPPLIRIEVKEIPPGTPWIWFFFDKNNNNNKFTKKCGRRNGTVPSFHDEEEVLLPPGTFIAKPKRKRKRGDTFKGIDVVYVPDVNATSINYGSGPIVRSLHPAMNKNNKTPLPNYAQLWRILNDNAV